MPKVSVIIPIYGVEQFIERCARSLFEQTLQEIEYIFVNDCTKDRSMEILSSVIDEYPHRIDQVKIINHETNKGLPIARQTGLSIATGEFIAHCDSDDWVEKDAYLNMYTMAVANNLDIVYCDYFLSDGSSKKYVGKIEKEKLLLGPVWNKLIRSALYDNFILYPSANKGEDGALMMQLSFYATKIGHLRQACYYYFKNSNSICRVVTEEACLNKHRQECSNLDLRIEFLRKVGALQDYEDHLVAWKLATRDNLLPLIKERKYYDLWMNTYPEINKKILLGNKVLLKSKVKYLLVRLHLYPILFSC